MTTKEVIETFLGKKRIYALLEDLDKHSRKLIKHEIGPIRVFLALLISLMPFAANYLYLYKETLDITTVFVGVAAVLSILFRIRHKIKFSSVKEWKRSLGHTHTAFALGCIPTVILLISNPHSFVPEHLEATGTLAQAPPIVAVITFILTTSVWAGLTEEFIYRGLLVSVLRRVTFFKTQRSKDRMAILVSALIFGLSHFPVWGLPVSLALVGLGIGFGIAYIALDELILPLVVYHIAFDFMSLSFALLAHRM